jgi:hypothetical protein
VGHARHAARDPAVRRRCGGQRSRVGGLEELDEVAGRVDGEDLGTAGT